MRRRILRWALIAAALLTLILTSSLYWLFYSESGLSWVLHRGLSAAAGKIEYQQLRGSMAQGFELDAPVIEVPGVTIHATQLQMRLQPWAVLRGELSLESLRLEGARYTFPETAATEESTPVARPGGIDLPLDVVLRNIELVANEINLGGDEPLVFSIGASEIALREGKIKIDGLALRQGDFALRTRAAVDTEAAWAGELASEGEWTLPSVAHRGRLTMSGDLDAVNVDLSVDGGGALSFEANLSQPMETPGISGRIGAQSLDLNSFGLHAPVRMLDVDLGFSYADDKFGISGPISIDGKKLELTVAGIELVDSQVHLQQLEIKSKEIGSLSFSGYWPLDAKAQPGQLEGVLKGVWLGDWRSTLPTPAPRLDGKLNLAGRMDDWHAGLDGSWRHADASGPLKLSATGTPERVTIAPSQLGWDGSELGLVGAVQLGEATQIELDLTLNQVNPGLLVADWPGLLDGSMHASVRVGEASAWGLSDVALEGLLRDHGFALRGELEGIDAKLAQGQLDLSWGEGQANLVVVDADTVSAELKRFDLSLVSPLTGELTGTLGTRLDGDLIADAEAALELRNFAAAGASSSLIELSKSQGWAVELKSEVVAVGGTNIKPLQLTTTGSAADHRLQLHIEEARGTIDLALSGALLDGVWAGSVDQIELHPKHGGDWSLAQPSAVRVEGDAISVTPLCLLSDPARLCVGVQRQAEQTLFDLDLREVSLGELQAWAPASDWSAAGKIGGAGQLSLNAEGQLGGALDFGIEDGRLFGPAGLEEPLKFDGLARFDGAAAEFSARLNLVDHGKIGVRATGLNTPDGELIAELAISDLSLVDGLTAEVQSMQGSLNGEVRAPMADPTRLQGQLEAAKLSFELPSVGLKATDGNLVAEFDEAGLLHLDGDLGIAPGRLHLEGLIALDESGASQITIRGDNAALVDLPAVRLVGDSNFVVKRSPDGFQVEGGVLLREGKIDLDRFAPAVPASEDVVIVDAPPPPPPLPIKADISLAFIQAVDLRGFGLEASLSGGIRVTQRPGIPTQAQGEMLVKGIYSAYGQKLDIERGRLGFTGRADNPSLDILAVKKVDRQRVGVQVRGNARRPAIRLYSDPSLDQSETVSYLVLGRPLATASGADGEQVGEYASALQSAGGGLVAGSIGQKIGVSAGVESFGAAIGSALVVGKYLSPRFFVGYGTSLLNATQLVILRFRFTENIEFEGISGSEQKVSASWRTER